MFIGHFALGFAAKRAAPRLSVAVLFAAAQFADLLWPFLVALGVEHVRIDSGNTAMTPLDFVSYPYSHSLLLLCLWGAIFGAICAIVVRRVAAAVTVAALVVSHWVLDWIAHRPDMPLYPGGPKLGLGLWNSVPATVTLESLLFAAGVWVYVTSTRPRDAIGRRAFAAFLAFIIVAYLGAMGPPPPSINALVIVSIAGAAVILVWAWWFDRHRSPLT